MDIPPVAKTSSTEEHSDCHFLGKLSAEMRNTVYEMVLCNNDITLRTNSGCLASAYRPRDIVFSSVKQGENLLALTETCKQVQDETTQMMYSMNKFRLEATDTFIDCDISTILEFRKRIGANKSSALKDLTISATGIDILKNLTVSATQFALYHPFSIIQAVEIALQAGSSPLVKKIELSYGNPATLPPTIILNPMEIEDSITEAVTKLKEARNQGRRVDEMEILQRSLNRQLTKLAAVRKSS